MDGGADRDDRRASSPRPPRREPERPRPYESSAAEGAGPPHSSRRRQTRTADAAIRTSEGGETARGDRHPGAPQHARSEAVEDGTIARLFFSKAGRQSPSTSSTQPRLSAITTRTWTVTPTGSPRGAPVRKGQVIGYVGTSGNAPKTRPHLHFAIFRLTDAKHWWEGTPIDPYDVSGSRLSRRNPRRRHSNLSGRSPVQADAGEELAMR